jgi:hypothetical protein
MTGINPGMTIREIALAVSTVLLEAGIDLVLTGGAVVSIYTENRYQSYDLDFISHAGNKEIAETLSTIGFHAKGRHFVHPDTDFFVEFPPPPLAIGNRPVKEVHQIHEGDQTLRLLTPTQSAMDRLAAYYFWNDRQALEQAILISKNQKLNFDEIKKWSIEEGAEEKFHEFFTQAQVNG